MMTFPSEADLLMRIRASLEAVGKAEHEMGTPDWFIRIASELARQANSMGLKCSARGKSESYDEPEFLWDFSAFIDDEEIPADDRFFAQAAIVGEVEWGNDYEIDRDFQKLLHADSLVCFMTFQKHNVAEAKKKLDWLEAAVRRRQGYARLRGLTRPPAFLLSCWVIKEHRFEDKVVLPT